MGKVKKITPITLPESLFIRSDEASLEDFVQQFYDTDKFCKWFNFFPIVWARFDKAHLDVGCTATFKFSCMPFSYKMTCVEVIPNQSYKMEIRGLMRGQSVMHFTRKDDGVLYENTITISGINKFVHTYYRLLLSPHHPKFMVQRLAIMKKSLIAETKKRRRKRRTNEA
jgi:hypothetical protein